MKITATLLFSILVLGMTFISCDSDSIDSPVPIVTPVPTPTPTPFITERLWYYDKISKTIDGITSPEVYFNSKCGGWDSILISKSGSINSYILLFDPLAYNYDTGGYGACVDGYAEGTWSVDDGRYKIPIVVGYKINDGIIEMDTDFFELESAAGTVLKLKSYPKNEEGKTTVTNITFVTLE